jgi:hypothetical protein
MTQNALSSTPNPSLPEQTSDGPPNALQSAAPQAGGGQQAPIPAPSHAQTVAALRHFHAIQVQLDALLKNPDLGKTSVKPAIIDGTTKLVSERILSPAEAVQQLSNVPEDPQSQRKWVQTMMMQTYQANEAVLAHRQNAVVSGTAPQEAPGSDYDPDDHGNHMAALATHYSGGKR